MFKTLFSSLFAVSMFALGAIGSWYLSNISSTDKPNDEQAATASDSTTQPATDESLTRTTSTVNTTPMPIVHGRSAMSAEELFHFGEANRSSLQDIKLEKERLAQEENRVKLQLSDLERTREEVAGLLAHNKQILDESDRLATQIQQKVQELNQLKEERAKQDKLEESSKGTTPNEDTQANIKAMAEILAAVPPEQAAGTLKNLANDGKMDFVVQLITKIPTRPVGKIFASLDDQVLIAEIAERIKDMKRAPKNVKR